tara:strand:+ start:415 stop:612 length:198 start_codon:yes stop_codon:yes gene_type:complete
MSNKTFIPNDIENMKQEDMVSNLHQVQHILNHLIEGKKYDGSKLDTDKLQNYKNAVIKILDQIKK